MLINGDCIEEMKKMQPDSVDSVVTDPPYFLGFMQKIWDTGTATEAYAFHLSWAKEALRVMKPGAYLLAFGGTRTFHRLACALEDAGFEIRDTICWLYGSGFPKSTAIDKQLSKHGYHDEADKWKGFGSALKPAHEPIIMARKPFDGPLFKNVLKHGTGGLNIDASRIAATDQENFAKNWDRDKLCDMRGGNYGNGENSGVENNYSAPLGRFPANALFSHNFDCVEVGTRRVKAAGGDIKAPKTSARFKNTHQQSGEQPSWQAHGNGDGTETVAAWECSEGCAVAELDRQSGTLKSGARNGVKNARSPEHQSFHERARDTGKNFDASQGGASRFFATFHDANRFIYTPKASKADRNAGLDKQINGHPTVKSTKLMEYLIRLVTPPSGIVLDPFMGSGSTGVAAKREGFKFVGIELSAEYFEIASKRIEQ